MTQTEVTTADPSEASKYFRIRKEVVGLLLLAMTSWTAYQVHDWWSHLNWPPFDGTNKEAIQNLGCKTVFPINKEELSKWNIGVDPAHAVDRRNFFVQPQCVAAGTYLYFEGSGTRQYFDVVDFEKKRRTARIEITFNQDERALK